MEADRLDPIGIIKSPSLVNVSTRRSFPPPRTQGSYQWRALFLCTYARNLLRKAPMIAQNLVDEVRRLLATGKYSQRQIARRTNVSRGTVNAIALGKRRNQAPKKETEVWGPFEGPIQRCPTCGGLVHMPCRLCETRQLMVTKRRLFPELPTKIVLGIQLKEEHLQRYEAIHRQRLLRGEPGEKSRQSKVYEEPLEWEAGGDEDLPTMYYMSRLVKGEI